MKNVLNAKQVEHGAPSEVEEAISEFFSSVGDAKGIEELLWDMLQASISNPNNPTDDQDNAARCYLYRRLKDFVEAIEPVYLSTKKDN